jgi:putative membrane protein
MESTVLSALALAGTAAHVGGPWAAGFGWLFFLVPLFWIAVIVLIVSLARRRWSRGWGPGAYGPGHHGYWGGTSRSAEASLAERFAQGDIDEKEYRARLEVLRANNPFTPPAK